MTGAVRFKTLKGNQRANNNGQTMSIFQVKICGITSVEDALACRDAGTDAIGLNFYDRSPRSVDAQAAYNIVQAIGGELAKVGVFVNAPLNTLIASGDQLGLDYLQLHGDEPLERLAQLAPRKVIRAFRLEPGRPQPVLDFVAACRRLAVTPAALLIDAHQPGSYGGTGKTANWGEVRTKIVPMSGINTILAGGLTPSNVRQAILSAHPAGVDVASGVETQPGRKCPKLVGAFVKAAR